jgi:hypothetical protein
MQEKTKINNENQLEEKFLDRKRLRSNNNNGKEDDKAMKKSDLRQGSKIDKQDKKQKMKIFKITTENKQCGSTSHLKPKRGGKEKKVRNKVKVKKLINKTNLNLKHTSNLLDYDKFLENMESIKNMKDNVNVNVNVLEEPKTTTKNYSLSVKPDLHIGIEEDVAAEIVSTSTRVASSTNTKSRGRKSYKSEAKPTSARPAKQIETKSIGKRPKRARTEKLYRNNSKKNFKVSAFY